MKKRSIIVTIIQIVATLGGLVGLTYLIALYIPASKVFYTDEANLGDVLATVFAFIPLSLVVGPVVAIFGIVDVVASAKQRANEETRDVLSLVFLILGIILIVLPVFMIASMFMASASKDSAESAIRLIL